MMSGFSSLDERRQRCKENDGRLAQRKLGVLLCLIAFTCHPVASSALSLGGPISLQPVALGAWEWYKTCLLERPLLTKSTTAAVLSSVSDAMTQTVERRANNSNNNHLGIDGKKNETAVAVICPSSSSSVALKQKEFLAHNWVRTIHIFITGFCYSGPMAHFWYQTLEQLCQHTVLQKLVVISPWTALGTRSILDALLFSPTTVAGYFVVRSLLERQPDPTAKLRAAWAKTVVSAWKFWPLVNVVSFTVVPLPYRVLYANVMSLLWTGYLSFVNQKTNKPEQ